MSKLHFVVSLPYLARRVKHTASTKMAKRSTRSSKPAPAEAESPLKTPVDGKNDKPLVFDLPNDILREVFQYLRNNEIKYLDFNIWNVVIDKTYYRNRTRIRNKRDLWLHRTSFVDMRDGRHVLCSLALVCRRWNAIATEMLYQEIQLNDCKSFRI